MKKTISILLILTASTHIFAQLGKGTFMPGISMNYNQGKSNITDSISGSNQNSSSKRSGIYAGINFGYFIKNNFAIGINVGYQRNNYDYSSSSSNTTNMSSNSSHQINNSYDVGAFARYYKMINNGKFGVFIQASAMYSRSYGKSDQKYYSSNSGNITPYSINNEFSDRTNSYNIDLTPGVVYFITNKIGIETSFGVIGYNLQDSKRYSQYNHTGNSNSQGFNVNLSSSTIRLGINYYLGKSKE